MGAVGDSGAARIEKNELRIEAMAIAHGPVHAPAVAENLGQLIDLDVPEVAGAVLARIKRDLGEHLVAFDGVNDEVHRCPVAAHQNEIDAVGVWGHTQRRGASTAGAVGRRSE